MFTFQKKKKKNSIIVPWPGFTDDGNCPFLLLSPFSLSLVFFLFLSIPLYLPPCPFLLIYSLNHALVLMGYNTDVSHTKCYSCPAWLDFLPVPGNRAATCKRKVENPYTFFFFNHELQEGKIIVLLAPFWRGYVRIHSWFSRYKGFSNTESCQTLKMNMTKQFTF